MTILQRTSITILIIVAYVLFSNHAKTWLYQPYMLQTNKLLLINFKALNN